MLLLLLIQDQKGILNHCVKCTYSQQSISNHYYSLHIITALCNRIRNRFIYSTVFYFLQAFVRKLERSGKYWEGLPRNFISLRTLEFKVNLRVFETYEMNVSSQLHSQLPEILCFSFISHTYIQLQNIY